MSSSTFPTANGTGLFGLYAHGLVRASEIQTNALMGLVDAGEAMARELLSSPSFGSLCRARERYGSAVARTLNAYVKDSVAVSSKQLAEGWELMDRTVRPMPAAAKEPAPVARVKPAEPVKPAEAGKPAETGEPSAAPGASGSGEGARAPSKRAPTARRGKPGRSAASGGTKRPKPRRRSPGFELLQDDEGSRFRLLAADGEAVLTSRSYPNPRSARKGLAAIIRSARREQSYERRTGPSGDAFFEIRAGNKRVLWRSAPYERAGDLEKDIARLMSTVAETEPPPG